MENERSKPDQKPERRYVLPLFSYDGNSWSFIPWLWFKKLFKK